MTVPKEIRLRVLLFILVLAFPVLSGAAGRRPEPQGGPAPRTKPGGGSWRVGYLEGGPFYDYQAIFMATLEGLQALGWLEKGDIPKPADPEENRPLWRWLAEEAESDFLTFLPDAYWSANWEAETRTANRREALQQLQQGEIDLMIAMGTWAGQDLVTTAHAVPTVVVSASDPVAAGIIHSPRDSGYDHVMARVDPERFQRQIRMFHQIFGFKRMGIAYENTRAGRSYAALADIQQAAAEKGFDVVHCHYVSDTPDLQVRFQTLMACHKNLARTIDAMFITTGGVPLDRFPEVLAPFFEEKIPTYSQSGSEEVRRGCLMSMAQADFRPVGRFYARSIARILNGVMPRRLPQVFSEPLKLALNLKTAALIGWQPPFEVLELADEIYHHLPSDDPPAEAKGPNRFR